MIDQKQINILLVLLLSWMSLNAQTNFIRNPGFEDFSTCPNDIDQMDRVNNWNHYISTPDYHNICGHHHNEINYFDNAAVMIVIYSTLPFLDKDRGFAREYVEGTLLQELVRDSLYLFEINIHQTRSSFTSNNFGVLFTDTPYTEIPDTNFIRLDPDLYWPDKMTQGEEEGWDIYRACYRARGGEQYLTLGGFYNDNEITNNRFSNSGSSNRIILDNVSLIKVPWPKELTILQSKDTICVGDCVEISNNQSYLFGSYFWELPGSDIGSSSDSTVTVCYDQPGQYDVFLRAEHCAGLFEEDFPRAITVLPGIEAESVADTTICAGESVRVDLSATGEKVCWEDGSEEVQRSFSAAGLYRYELSNGFCSRKDSFRIIFYNDPVGEEVAAASCEGESFEFLGQSYSAPGIYRDTMKDVAGCDSVYFRIDYDYFPEEEIPLDGEFGFCVEQESTSVSVPADFEDIAWSTGEEGSAITLNSPGSYAVSVLDENGCPRERSFEIIQYPSPEVVAVDLIDIWYTDNMPLEANYSSDVTSYNWQGEALSCTDCPEPLLLEAIDQDLLIEVRNEQGCMAADTLSLRFRTANVYLPSILSKEPNLPQNGVLFAQSDVDIIYDLQVYDRWGGLLYNGQNLQSNDLTQGWRPQEDLLLGVYVYLVTYRENGQQVLLSGDVTVVR